METALAGMSESWDSDIPKERGVRVSNGSKHSLVAVVEGVSGPT